MPHSKEMEALETEFGFTPKSLLFSVNAWAVHRSDMDNLRVAHTAVTKAQAKAKEAMNERAVLANTLAACRIELVGLTEDRTALDADLTYLRQRCAELAQKEKEMDEFRRTHGELLLETVKNDYHARLQSEVMMARETIHLLKSQGPLVKTQHEHKLGEVNEQVRGLRLRVADLEEKIVTRERAIEEHLACLGAARQDRDRLIVKVRALEASLVEANQLKTAALNQEMASQIKINDMTTTLSSLTLAAEQHQRKLKELNEGHERELKHNAEKEQKLEHKHRCDLVMARDVQQAHDIKAHNTLLSEAENKHHQALTRLNNEHLDAVTRLNKEHLDVVAKHKSQVQELTTSIQTLTSVVTERDAEVARFKALTDLAKNDAEEKKADKKTHDDADVSSPGQLPQVKLAHVMAELDHAREEITRLQLVAAANVAPAAPRPPPRTRAAAAVEAAKPKTKAKKAKAKKKNQLKEPKGSQPIQPIQHSDEA